MRGRPRTIGLTQTVKFGGQGIRHSLVAPSTHIGPKQATQSPKRCRDETKPMEAAGRALTLIARDGAGPVDTGGFSTGWVFSGLTNRVLGPAGWRGRRWRAGPGCAESGRSGGWCGVGMAGEVLHVAERDAGVEG